MDIVSQVEIGRAECLTLLRAEVVGRVVYTRNALPTARPVVYVLDEDEVLFGTPAEGGFAEATRNAVVAFEADLIDRRTWTGWTVLGVGETYEVDDARRIGAFAAQAQAGALPWAGGRVVALPLSRLTGSLILAREPHLPG